LLVGIGVTSGYFLGERPVRLVTATIGLVYHALLAIDWQGSAGALSTRTARRLSPERASTVDLPAIKSLARLLCAACAVLLAFAAFRVT
jgi:hypothetical protein